MREPAVDVFRSWVYPKTVCISWGFNWDPTGRCDGVLIAALGVLLLGQSMAALGERLVNVFNPPSKKAWCGEPMFALEDPAIPTHVAPVPAG